MTPGNNRQAPPDRIRSRPPDPEPLAPLIDAHTHLDACGAVTAADVRAMVDHAESAGGIGEDNAENQFTAIIIFSRFFF
ncbi:hypothetical protein I3U54_23880, partial [Mycobacteroides abscessus subsp. abscessus]|nr:hypothetical protein [Mycobacteroides abscessus subsp. abscessus]